MKRKWEAGVVPDVVKTLLKNRTYRLEVETARQKICEMEDTLDRVEKSLGLETPEKEKKEEEVPVSRREYTEEQKAEYTRWKTEQEEAEKLGPDGRSLDPKTMLFSCTRHGRISCRICGVCNPVIGKPEEVVLRGKPHRLAVETKQKERAVPESDFP